ncbi:hypothetical protein DFS34DRAFT_632190 [Phlyctochytrium arcticum]|nr:hypothetical protein DFS34DRAFT_632190 [Phlyctochytrium arcticum]
MSTTPRCGTRSSKESSSTRTAAPLTSSSPIAGKRALGNDEGTVSGMSLPASTSLSEKYSKDATMIERVKHIIKTQFDYEILLKRHELRAIRNQISRGEDAIQQLHFALINATSPGPSSRVDSPGLFSTRTSGRTLRNSSNRHLSGAESLISRREDGAYVRLSCPVCQRWAFANMQGFINHCRIKHQIEFPSHMEAARACGAVVDESEVPQNHAARRMPIRVAAFDKPTNFEWGKPSIVTTEETDFGDEDPLNAMIKDKPQIKVYEEEVDMADSSSSQIQKPFVRISLRSVQVDSEMSPSALASDNGIVNNGINSDTDARTSRDKENAMETHMDHIAAPITENHPEPPSSLRGMEAEKAPTQETEQSEENSIQTVNATIRSTPATEKSQNKPGDSSFSHGSRFYIRRTISIGNVSQYIPPDKRDPGMRKFEFKWMIYLHGVTAKDDISSFVRKVRFYLHPDYRPYDVVEVAEPPFRLTRYGWGEFPVRAQLYFVDESNKPVDFIHILKLDQSKSEKQTFGAERTIELELDRNTKFAQAREVDRMIGVTTPSGADDPQRSKSPEEKASSPHSFGIPSTLNRELETCVRTLPVVLSTTNDAKKLFPYTVAPSRDVWHSWPLGKRKAIEWQRARIIRLRLQSQISVVDAAALTTANVMRWCTARNLTPSSRPDDISDENKTAIKPLTDGPGQIKQYCRFCGTLSDNLSHRCAQPPLWKRRLWSLRPLLDENELSGYELEDDDGDLHIGSSHKDTRDQSQLNTSLSDLKENADLVHPACDAKDIEWVKRTIDQLRLPASPGSESLSDRATLGILFQATGSFLARLLAETINVYRSEMLSEPQNPEVPPEADQVSSSRPKEPPKIIVPYHVYKALVKDERKNGFDFLTGAGLAGSAES